MVRNLERVLAKLPPERREKVERREAELATLKDLRQAVKRAQEELASYLGVGQDIRNAFYAVNDGYKYFRMELYGSPNQDANGYASIYGFFINSGNGWNFPLYLDPLVVPTVDSFLNATVTPTLSGNLQFLPDGRTFITYWESSHSTISVSTGTGNTSTGRSRRISSRTTSPGSPPRSTAAP